MSVIRSIHPLLLAASATACVLLALAAAFSRVPFLSRANLGPEERSIAAALTLAPHEIPWLVDQPVMIEVRVTNSGSGPATILAPASAMQMLDRRAAMRLTMMDSANAMSAPRPAGSTPQRQAVALFPGAFWGCDVNLLDLFGSLAPDVYRLRIECEVSDEEAASMQGLAAPLWVGRASSPWQTLQIRAPDQERVVDEHARQWKSSQASGGNLRALQWLAANALENGMAAERVTQLLGPPVSIDRNGDGSVWHYRVGRIGFEVRIEADRVASTTFSEQ